MPVYIPNINRAIMAETLNELGFKIGLELGVAQGNHAKLLCEKIPGLKLFCVDIWERYKGYLEYTDRIDRYYQLAQEQLASFNCAFIKEFSMDAVKKFDDYSLDFVYIDGAHDFKSVALDLCEWSKKVRVGGIVFGHDFKRPASGSKYVVDVKDVVPAYCYAKKIKPWFVLGQTGHNDGEYKEGVQSWMFVRQGTDKL
jgi:predicted O-methyltransferase YrrM